MKNLKRFAVAFVITLMLGAGSAYAGCGTTVYYDGASDHTHEVATTLVNEFCSNCSGGQTVIVEDIDTGERATLSRDSDC
jgi:hypothetical protein